MKRLPRERPTPGPYFPGFRLREGLDGNVVSLTDGGFSDSEGIEARARARGIFLDVVFDVEPKALEELLDRPLAEMRSALALATERAPVPHMLYGCDVSESDDVEWLVQFMKHYRNGQPLLDWGSRWRLCENYIDWPFLAVMTNLLLFCSPWWQSVAAETGVPPEKPPVALIYPPEMDAIVSESLQANASDHNVKPLPVLSDVVFSLGSARVNLGRESVTEAYHRVMAEVGRNLRNELDKAAAEAKTLGFVAPKIRRSGLDHFYWLARYQVKGEGYAEIGRIVCKERPTIKEAVQKTAMLIGLPLRDPDPAGRPRNSRPTPPRIVRLDPSTQ